MNLPIVLHITGIAVIFGGGEVAKRKVQYLTKFTTDIRVIAEHTWPMPTHVYVQHARVTQHNISRFIPKNTALIIAALSDMSVNRAIAWWAHEHKILVNVVDVPALSTVFFPALANAGDLSIAISTSGKCPFLAKEIRKQLESWITTKARLLEVLAPIREQIVGLKDKNDVLNHIYENPDIAMSIAQGNMQKAHEKAEEILHMHCK